MNKRTRPKVTNPDATVDTLVETNMRLAYHFTEQLGRPECGRDRDQTFSLAMEGLLRAAREWDGSIPFGSYASMRIKWWIIHYDLLRHRVKRGGSGEAGLKTKLVTIHLETLVGSDGATVQDFIADQSPRADELATAADTADRVNALLAAMEKPRLRKILEWRFGVGGRRRLTLEEVGEKMGLTRERIRQLEADGLASLAKATNRSTMYASHEQKAKELVPRHVKGHHLWDGAPPAKKGRPRRVSLALPGFQPDELRRAA